MLKDRTSSKKVHSLKQKLGNLSLAAAMLKRMRTADAYTEHKIILAELQSEFSSA
jgi:hypothetical protein